MMSPNCGAERDPPARGLEPTSPQHEAGMRIEPPPSLACAAGDHARGHRGRRAAAGAAGRAGRDPRGCAWRRRPAGSVVERMPSSGVLVLPRKTKPASRNRLASSLSCVLDPADLAQEAHALVHRVAGRVRGQVLEQEGHAAERAVGQVAGRGGARLVEQRRDHRVELGVEPLDALDRLVDQLARACLPASNQLRLFRGVRDRTGHAAKLTQVQSAERFPHPALAGVEVPAVALGQHARRSRRW